MENLELSYRVNTDLEFGYCLYCRKPSDLADRKCFDAHIVDILDRYGELQTDYIVVSFGAVFHVYFKHYGRAVQFKLNWRPRHVFGDL